MLCCALLCHLNLGFLWRKLVGSFQQKTGEMSWHTSNVNKWGTRSGSSCQTWNVTDKCRCIPKAGCGEAGYMTGDQEGWWGSEGIERTGTASVINGQGRGNHSLGERQGIWNINKAFVIPFLIFMLFYYSPSNLFAFFMAWTTAAPSVSLSVKCFRDPFVWTCSNTTDTWMG